MKLPYVSRDAFDAACARADAEHENAQALRRQLADTEAALKAVRLDMKVVVDYGRGEEDKLRAAGIAERNAADKRYADLLDKYHALREKGYGHLEALPIAPQADFFGPRTRAALDAVGRGLPRDSRRAMEASARKLVEQEMTDDQIAALVRKGEPVRGVV